MILIYSSGVILSLVLVFFINRMQFLDYGFEISPKTELEEALIWALFSWGYFLWMLLHLLLMGIVWFIIYLEDFTFFEMISERISEFFKNDNLNNTFNKFVKWFNNEND